jgi:glucose-6-phosphate isomerase
MSIDARQTAVGTSLLLASSVLFLPTGVDGRVSVLLAVTAVAAAALALVRLLGSTDGRTV